VAKSAKDEDWDWAQALVWVAFRGQNRIDHAAEYLEAAAGTRKKKTDTRSIEKHFQKIFLENGGLGGEPRTTKLDDPDFVQNLRLALKKGRIEAKIKNSNGEWETVSTTEWKLDPAPHFPQVFMPKARVKAAFPAKLPPIGECVRAPGVIERAGEKLGRLGEKKELARWAMIILYRRTGYYFTVPRILAAWKGEEIRKRLAPFLTQEAKSHQDDGRRGALKLKAKRSRQTKDKG
jgi:hypothetical protein